MMNRKLKRVILIALSAAVLTGAALAAVLGELINGHETFLGAGMELSRGVYWTGSDYRTENYIEYTPNTDVVPVVVSGSKVCNYGKFSTMAALLENQGKHVIAGINGDYFVVATNEPLGIVVQDGELLSSDAGNYAVGFKADGTAVFGKPALNISVKVGDVTIPMNAVNKTRNHAQIVLYTDAYAAKTKNTGEGMDFICSMDRRPTMNGTVNLTIEQILLDGGAVDIPAGKAVLSVSGTLYEQTLANFTSLVEGDTMSVTVSSPSEWSDVSYAIGSLYKLVTNGEVESGLDNTAAPRTAVGMKADGSLVLYTMDGRQTGHSVGVSMTTLANRMKELGCTEATIMDGGGSTSLNAIYIGDSSASQINSPSDGAQRSVTDYIMLVTQEKPTGVPSRLALYPLSTNILAGATTTFTLKAADENGYPATLSGGVTLSSDGVGSIEQNGVFKAEAAGSGTVTAAGEGLTGAAVQVRVVQTPDILNVFNQSSNKKVTALNVQTETKTDLLAQAMDNYVYLISQDTCYNWSVSGNIGAIDENGVFTAGTETASGSITVAAGEKSVTIPVTVTRPGYYDDVQKGDWFYDGVDYVTEKSLMNGIADRVFDPSGNMSRAMAVTVLYRLSGSPTPSESAPGFSDVPAGQWYSDAVAWAAEKGVVQGVGENLFAPGSTVTREQLAAILYRFYGSPETAAGLGGFEDAGSVSSWAVSALGWCGEKGLVTGTSASTLSPAGSASRAQMAVILQRMSGLSQ